MIETKHRGAHSEMIACAWLIEQGYEVFRNVSQHGEIDVVGRRAGVFESFDVKTSLNEKQRVFGTPSQAKQAIRLILVRPGGECSFADAEPANASLNCPNCGASFHPRKRRHNQVYCSVRCSNAVWAKRGGRKR